MKRPICTHLTIIVNSEDTHGRAWVSIWNEDTQEYINKKFCRSKKSVELYVEFLKEQWNLPKQQL